ncbi:MAG TPA: hypothetical protein VEA69_23605 [Tepidisphaeraceae bacterium]|nr:hypothetical protein [Tepidisphaeraceae bacterium]
MPRRRLLTRALVALALLAWLGHLGLWATVRGGTLYGYGFGQSPRGYAARSIDAYVFPGSIWLQYNAGFFPADPSFGSVGGLAGIGPLSLRPFDYDFRDGQAFGAGRLYRVSVPHWFVSGVLALPWGAWLIRRLRRHRRDRVRGFEVEVKP